MEDDTRAAEKAKRAAYMREWRKRRQAAGLPVDQRTSEGKERRRESIAEWTRRHRARKRAADPNWRPESKRTPEMHRAAEAVRRAVRAGKLVRPTVCEECGTDGVAIEAAHYDYDSANYLVVRWLCRRCHRRWDAADPKSRCKP